MSMTDPIADFLTRIRNGLQANKRWVDIPASKMKKRIAFILKEEKYVDDFIFIRSEAREQIRVFLRYDSKGKPIISKLERVSRPGRRVYVSSTEIPRVLAGMGISILSTSRGVVSNKIAKRLKVGGEVICNIW